MKRWEEHILSFHDLTLGFHLLHIYTSNFSNYFAFLFFSSLQSLPFGFPQTVLTPTSKSINLSINQSINQQMPSKKISAAKQGISRGPDRSKRR